MKVKVLGSPHGFVLLRPVLRVGADEIVLRALGEDGGELYFTRAGRYRGGPLRFDAKIDAGDVGTVLRAVADGWCPDPQARRSSAPPVVVEDEPTADGGEVDHEREVDGAEEAPAPAAAPTPPPPPPRPAPAVGRPASPRRPSPPPPPPPKAPAQPPTLPPGVTARPYDKRMMLEAGEWVMHQTFGTGQVESAAEGKAFIIFPSGARPMLCGVAR